MTWPNISGTQILLGTGTAAAPAFSFVGDPDTGAYRVGANALGIATAGVSRWQWGASGHYVATTDNALDIGNAGANRPRTVNVGTSLVVPLLTTTATTVGALGAATTVGDRKFVTDSLTPVFGSTVTAGGAVPVPVYADGSNWIVG